MPRTGFLLPLLLAATLVFNGIGGALAGARMEARALAVHVAAHEAQPAKVHAGCHEQSAMPADAGGHADEAGHEGGAPADDDCCGSGFCGCACAQLPQLAGGEPLLPAAAIASLPDADASFRERPSPALPHLIRPPIG